MKQLTILSGKGGTGKTTITASFAVLAKNAVVADCDVDAPDLHMLLHPEVIEMQQLKAQRKLLSTKQNVSDAVFAEKRAVSVQ
jgi:MinD superfamily P-loop ATPase